MMAHEKDAIRSNGSVKTLMNEKKKIGTYRVGRYEENQNNHQGKVRENELFGMKVVRWLSIQIDEPKDIGNEEDQEYHSGNQVRNNEKKKKKKRHAKKKRIG